MTYITRERRAEIRKRIELLMISNHEARQLLEAYEDVIKLAREMRDKLTETVRVIELLKGIEVPHYIASQVDGARRHATELLSSPLLSEITKEGE